MCLKNASVSKFVLLTGNDGCMREDSEERGPDLSLSLPSQKFLDPPVSMRILKSASAQAYNQLEFFHCFSYFH